jgi:hypothetical protein
MKPQRLTLTAPLGLALLACATSVQAAPAAAAAPHPGFAAAADAYKELDNGAFAAAVGHARRAAEAEPANRDYRLLLISSLQRAGQAEAAEAEAARFERDFGPDAQLAAQRGYLALGAGRKADALDHFMRAVSLPGLDAQQSRTARLTAADLALERQDPAKALEALRPLASDRSYETQSRLAFALWGADEKPAAADAFKAAAAAAPGPEERGVMTRAHINALISLERRDEARAAFREADKAGALIGPSTGASEAATLAAALHEDARAQALFREADARGDAPPRMWLDAGYSADRLADKALAVRHFSRAIDESRAGRLELTPEETFRLRRANAEMSREWGAYLSAFYGANDAVNSSLFGRKGVTQLGGEAYWRPRLDLNGAEASLFGRAFITVDGPRGTATGGKTVQAWAGVQLKPFRAHNFVLEGSKMVKVGDLARDDWMARAAWSTTAGLDPIFEKHDRMMWSAYLEGARIFRADQNLGYADLRVGRAFVLAPQAGPVVAPFLGAVYSYDSKARRESALGAGPGVVARVYFRDTTYKVAQSYVELTVQYRARVSGDMRARGLYASATLSY